MEASAQGAGPAARGLLARPTAREGLLLGIVLALLSALPYLVAQQPQLTDYPAHLARYHVMLDGGRSPWLARYYDFEWLIRGNLGADLLVWPLAKVFGIETAGWLIGFMIPPLTGLGLIAVDWQLRQRVGVGAWLAFATIWSPAMGMGFYNFCLALALALFAFAGWIRLEGWRWRWALYLPVGLLVWLCHVAGWGILGVLVFGYEWSRRKRVSAVIAPWPLLLPLIPSLVFAEVTGPGSLYGKAPWVYKFAVFVQTLRDQSIEADLLTLIFLIVLFLVALILRKVDGRLGWATLILAGLCVVMPRHFGGGDYADYRLMAVTLMIGALAISWQPPRWLYWAVPLLFLYRVGLITEAWKRDSAELELALKALDKLPEGARVAGAVVVEARSWSLDPYEHAPAYATVRRDALVNAHFAVPGVHMLRLKQGGKDFVDPSHRIIIWPGQTIDLTRFAPLRQADYLWYFGPRRPDRMPPGVQVLYATRTSFLARLAKPPVGS